MAAYFWYDKFENDDFESDKFILRTSNKLVALKLVIFKLATPKIQDLCQPFLKFSKGSLLQSKSITVATFYS